MPQAIYTRTRNYVNGIFERLDTDLTENRNCKSIWNNPNTFSAGDLCRIQSRKISTYIEIQISLWTVQPPASYAQVLAYWRSFHRYLD